MLRGVRFDFRLTDLTRFCFIVRFMVSDSGISLRVSLKEKKGNKMTQDSQDSQNHILDGVSATMILAGTHIMVTEISSVW
jgi:hypothetical protein